MMGRSSVRIKNFGVQNNLITNTTSKLIININRKKRHNFWCNYLLFIFLGRGEGSLLIKMYEMLSLNINFNHNK